MSINALIERRNNALGTGAQLFYKQPLHLVRGEGVHLYDSDGRRYTDMYNNVPCVGHGNKVVAEAMARQQRTLNVHSRYLHEGIIEYAERLASLHPVNIESVVFSCSGTEANEVALRMARIATGKRGIICTNGTYHGNSEAVGAMTRIGQSSNDGPDLRAVPFPETYRPLIPGASDADLRDAYLNELARTIASLEASSGGFAGLIICSIFANEGLPNVPRGYMEKAVEMVHAAGGVVISDEVQAGYCRTGHWWGYEVTDFVPDIVVTGKPMGNGLPLSATAASRDLVNKFRAGVRYFNTFASSPLQAAVGMAVLDEIEGRQLRANGARIGNDLKQALLARQSGHPCIDDIRGYGLFIGLEIIKPGTDKAPDSSGAVDICNALKDNGFLTSNAGVLGNVVKIRPPLVFTDTDATEFLVAFDTTMAKLNA
ncbi:MAG: 4-aminobutyrate aminotransferase-like enzyme [Flavobacterium sp.]|jgi:4-aminobutyrate aminotransferase-like enzyme